jgi:hypothetical protein
MENEFATGVSIRFRFLAVLFISLDNWMLERRKVMESLGDGVILDRAG